MTRPANGTELRTQLLSGAPVAERRLELAGISTNLLEAGEGPPIVLLHGPGEHALKWLALAPLLAHDHRLIAPDLPGHGETTLRDAALTAEHVLSWLGELIEQTCSTPPLLVGHAVGGAIAARFAARHPTRLRALVLEDSLGLVPFHPLPEFEQALMAYFAAPDETTHERLWDECTFDFGRVRRRLGERWNTLQSYNIDRTRAPALHAARQLLMQEFGFPAVPPVELARITVPAALVWGRHDPVTRLQVAQSASARYGWPLHVIDDAGADPETEQPEQFAAILRAIEAELLHTITT